MKTVNIRALVACCLMAGGFLSCQNTWEDHYTQSAMESEDLVIWTGDIESYIHSQTDLTRIDSLLTSQGMYTETAVTNGYTYVVYDNAAMLERNAANDADLALNSVSDIAVSPTKLIKGFGIGTRLGKNIWVNEVGSTTYLDNFRLTKKVKATNGYVYYVEKVVPIRPSVYDELKNLGSNYSQFVSLVEKYEESYFDQINSTPTGVDQQGNVTYDSIISVRNTLMDRYTADGLKMWDMRSENYISTMFIPSNTLVNNAIQAALDSIPKWLGRAATPADRTKFEKWIVSSCFVNRRLAADEVASTGADFDCVGGYQLIIDKTQDAKTYEAIDPARWRPSVQTVDANNPVALSNGVAYFLNSLKIPNHIVIYRVKSKFYELWGAMTADQKAKYFRWNNWIEPQILNDAQSSFTLSATLPTMYYHVLTAIPSAAAIRDSLVCSVTYDGLLYNSATNKLTEAYLPAGEYYLRMGFKHSLRYSINIWFNDRKVVDDMLLQATGSNFHFDRGSVSDLDFYGSSSIGFPEGYDWRDWFEKDPKSVAYDTDGYQVAIVTIPRSGNFTITIESNDDSYLYDATNLRTKNNVTQLMMYHWCLRPTRNNY
jgi:hypothetical protein